jgi:hypothetical protein
MGVFQRLMTNLVLRMSATDAKDEVRWREERRRAGNSRPGDNRQVRKPFGSY